MHLKRALLLAVFGLMTIVTNVASASAFCADLRYSARGLSEESALKEANRQGLVEVKRLNTRYGSRVKYQPAASKCTGGSHVRCTITQRYCVTEAGGPVVVRDTCPGDSVRNKIGQCVKEDEPVRANPCSGGRLFSVSREACHCPENRPVWTGQQCISAQPIGGPTNSQIKERCQRLDLECKSGVPGTCRALKQYCDRG